MIRAIALVLALSFALVSPSSIRAEEVSIKHGGLTLLGNLELAEGKTAADPIALITHGTLAHNGMEIIRTLQGLLKERGISSLAITLSLGVDERRGTLDCRVAHEHKHTDAIGEIGAWIDWLKDQGTTKIHLVGHSRGGNQSAWVAAEHDRPEIAKVVLIAPQTWKYTNVMLGYRNFYKRDLLKLMDAAEKIKAEGKGSEMLQFVDFLYCARTSVTADAFTDYYANDPRMDTPHLIPSIKKPVLVVWGPEDKTVLHLDEKMEGLADGDKVRFVVIEDADHFFLDLFAEDLADAVVEFLQE